MEHIFIILIIFFAYIVYEAWFVGGYYKKHFESGFIPGMPKNLQAYAIAYKALTLIFFIFMIFTYIIMLIEVPFYVFGIGMLLILLLFPVSIAWFTDDYKDLYEKEVFDLIIPKSLRVYDITNKAFTLSIYLIAVCLSILIITRVIPLG